MRIASTLLLCLVAGSAGAAECGRWTASMEEDEGGPRMMASVCVQASSSTPEAQHMLLVQCGTKDSLSMRYLPFADETYPPGGNEEYKTQVEFALDQEMFKFDAQYEGMDGALAMDANIDTPFIKTMMSQKEFTVSDVNSDKVPSATFKLKGAKKALQKLIKTCGD